MNFKEVEFIDKYTVSGFVKLLPIKIKRDCQIILVLPGFNFSRF